MNIYEYFRPWFRMTKESGRFGLEIETEVLNFKDYKDSLAHDHDNGGYMIQPASKFWFAKTDNSLRNIGVEFILKKPHDYKGVLLALEEFNTIFAGVPFLKDAPATSIHVHMNVQGHSARQLGNLIVTWTLFENLLVEFSGSQRRSNLFTLPVRCAEGNVKNFVRLFNLIEQKNPRALSFSENDAKYAALNIACMQKLGTVEARSFRGETDTNKIEEWIRLLDSLVEFSLRDITPLDILDLYRREGLELIYRVFGESASLLLKVDNPEAFIERNLFYGAIIADAVVDWRKLDPVFVHKEDKTVYKSKMLLGDQPTVSLAQLAAQQAAMGWHHIPNTEPPPTTMPITPEGF